MAKERKLKEQQAADSKKENQAKEDAEHKPEASLAEKQPVIQANQKSSKKKMEIEEITVEAQDDEEVEKENQSTTHKKKKHDKESYAVRKTKAQRNLIDAGPTAEEQELKSKEVKNK